MIGIRLQSLRKQKSLSQKGLAEAIGASQGYISALERDEKIPGGEILLALKDFFGVDLNWLLTGKGLAQRIHEESMGVTPEKPHRGLAQRIAEDGPEADSPMPWDDFHLGMGDSMELLVNIHKSGNKVLIRAINANLMAFNEAIENKERSEITVNAIAEMREQMKIMNGEIADLRHENQDLRQKILSRDDREQAGEAVG